MEMINQQYFNGIPIFVVPSYLLGEPIGYAPRRKHKNKRINKKWAKKYSKPIYDEGKTILFDNKLFVTETVFKLLKSEAEDGNDD